MKIDHIKNSKPIKMEMIKNSEKQAIVVLNTSILNMIAFTKDNLCSFKHNLKISDSKVIVFSFNLEGYF